MRKRLFLILLLFTPLLGGVGGGFLFAQDYARLSERTIMGTARYVGMGGAMTAIGGDPSSVLDNPAGLGLYQRAEAMVTFDGMFDYTRQVGEHDRVYRGLFMCPQASLIFHLPNFTPNASGIQGHNFMLSYHRLQSYSRTFNGYGTNEASLGSIMPAINIPFYAADQVESNSLNLRESGYVNKYSFNWALNIAHKWYVGLGLHIQDFIVLSEANYVETFADRNAEGAKYYNQNRSSLQFAGVGFSASAGLIYRPLKWLRMGLSVEAPSVGNMRTYTSGTFSALTDSLRNSYAPDLTNSDRSFHMPLHVSSSVAFQIGAYGMLSLQYDYRNQLKETPVHSLRAGLEVIPVMGMYINAGYAYESTFKPANAPVALDPDFNRQDAYFIHPRNTQYVSAAVGYRGPNVIVQAAYQYRWQNINLFAHEAANPYDIHTDTHRIVVTIGWHRN